MVRGCICDFLRTREDNPVLSTGDTYVLKRWCFTLGLTKDLDCRAGPSKANKALLALDIL